MAKLCASRAELNQFLDDADASLKLTALKCAVVAVGGDVKIE
jgi:hypothetical protein